MILTSLDANNEKKKAAWARLGTGINSGLGPELVSDQIWSHWDHFWSQ